MKNTISTIIIILFGAMCGCSEKTSPEVTTSGDVSTIHIQNIKPQEIKMSSVVDTIEYVKLETNENCLIGNITKIIPMGDTILVADSELSRKIYLFDKNGKFIRQIAQRGEGPQEYERFSDVVYDKVNKRFFILDGAQNKMLIYDVNGTFVDYFTFEYNVKNIEYVGNNILAMYFWSPNINTLSKDGMSPTLGLYDVLKKELISLNVWKSSDINSSAKMLCLNILQQNVNGGAYFYQDLCDTIYSIKGEKVAKNVCLDFGKSHTEAQEEFIQLASNKQVELKEVFKKRQELPMYMINRALFGNDIFIILLNSQRKTQLLMYNKNTNHIKITALKDIDGFGIKNDIDRLSKFTMYAADKECVYGTINPEILLLPLKLQLPPSLDSIKKITTDTDNPIIVKFKMKDF